MGITCPGRPTNTTTACCSAGRNTAMMSIGFTVSGPAVIGLCAALADCANDANTHATATTTAETRMITCLVLIR